MEGTVYGRRQADRLGPREIRSKRFARLRLGRRGVDPEEVRRFLGRVAAEVAELRAELAAAREEGARLPQRLAVYLTQYLPDAVNDLGRMSVADVTERIVGWCTRPTEGPALSARPRRPRWPRRSI